MHIATELATIDKTNKIMIPKRARYSIWELLNKIKLAAILSFKWELTTTVNLFPKTLDSNSWDTIKEEMKKNSPIVNC